MKVCYSLSRALSPVLTGLSRVCILLLLSEEVVFRKVCFSVSVIVRIAFDLPHSDSIGQDEKLFLSAAQLVAQPFPEKPADLFLPSPSDLFFTTN